VSVERRALPTQLPRGARIYLPGEAAGKRAVEERLLDVFRRWGYREVVTSAYEYFDVLALGTDQEVQERMFRMVDRESGRLLALRADVTPQIGRIVATRMREEPKPLRLCYATNVFRYDEPHVGRYREFYQAGVELVGLPNPEGDAEMIAMTAEALGALGLGQFQIDVGQTDFFRGILEELGADAAATAELRSALGRKDQAALERAVADLGAPVEISELVLALPSLYGRGDVLERAERLAKSARAEAALGNLAETYRLLRAYGLADAVLLDLGEVRGFDYYSGVHFEAYVSGLGAPLAGGGRYDHMLARFGYDCPATGFALDVGRALLAMTSQSVAVEAPGPEFFVIDFTADKTRALALARRFRGLGAAVARDILSRPLADSLAHARRLRARWALVIAAPGTERDPELVSVIELHGGAERVVPLRDLLSEPARHFPGLGGGGDGHA
jgi:ATP phosphoribosyltransferase regulatory subunit